MIIYRTTDRIPVKLGEYRIWISPLTHDHYTRIMSLKDADGNPDHKAMGSLTIRHIVKEVEGFDGFEFVDKSKFSLEFEPSGDCLTVDCLDNLLQVLSAQSLSVLASKSIARDFKDLDKLPGIEFELDKVKTAKKNEAAA